MERKQYHSVTIQDVAREAGVGLGTVSRVLNDHPSVSDSTRKRVMDVVARMNYQPNIQARRLVRGKAETVCFVLSNREFIDPYHALVLRGAQRFFAGIGQQVIYLPFEYPETARSENLVLPRIIAARGVVDGVILAGTNRRNLLEALQRANVPYVVFGNNLIPGEGDIPDSVWFDDRDGGRQVCNHFLDMGRKHVWYIGDIKQPWFKRRWEGFSEAAQARGASISRADDVEAEDSVQYGYKSACRIVDEKKPADAIFAGNDAIAYGVWKALDERGISIPEQIAIVGFDDRELTRLTSPNLSSVRTFNEEIGRECARLLLEKLEKPDQRLPMVMLPTELVVRRSSDPNAPE